PVKQYSSGMYMRLAFAIGAEVDPDILLLDEVLSVGDSAFQEKCIQRIEDFRRRGKTIVFVSHSMDAVRRLCNRALLLDHGKIIANGNPEHVQSVYHEILYPQLVTS